MKLLRNIALLFLLLTIPLFGKYYLKTTNDINYPYNMAFNNTPVRNYGPGNWLNLPELGISEKLFGGKTQSTNDAMMSQRSVDTSANKFVQPIANPYVAPTYQAPQNTQGSVQGTTDYKPTQAPQNNNYSAPSQNDRQRVSNEGGFIEGGVYYPSQDAFNRANPNYQPDNGQEQYLREVGQTFDQGNRYLDQSQASLEAGKNDFINQFTGQFNAQKPLLQNARDTGLQQIDQNRQSEQAREQSALSAARNLYNELSQAGRSTFGSGALSSAGQAASCFI